MCHWQNFSVSYVQLQFFYKSFNCMVLQKTVIFRNHWVKELTAFYIFFPSFLFSLFLLARGLWFIPLFIHINWYILYFPTFNSYINEALNQIRIFLTSLLLKIGWQVFSWQRCSYSTFLSHLYFLSLNVLIFGCSGSSLLPGLWLWRAGAAL